MVSGVRSTMLCTVQAGLYSAAEHCEEQADCRPDAERRLQITLNFVLNFALNFALEFRIRAAKWKRWPDGKTRFRWPRSATRKSLVLLSSCVLLLVRGAFKFRSLERFVFKF